MEGKAMTKLVTLTFTHDEALDIRLALSAASSSWHTKGREARARDSNQEAQSCDAIGDGYARMWTRIHDAMEANDRFCREAASTALRAGDELAQIIASTRTGYGQGDE